MEPIRDMYEVYSVLRKLTRRPMRSWWRSTGAAILAVIIVLITAKVALEITALRRAFFPETSLGVEISLKNSVIPCAVILLAITLWFLAALNLKMIFASALQDLPLESTPAAARAAFFMLLLQGTPSGLAIFIVSAPYGNYLFWEAISNPNGVMYSSTASELADSCAALMLGMMWVVLLLCVLRSQHWLVSATWLIIMITLPVSFTLLEGVRGFGSIYTPPVAPLSYAGSFSYEWSFAYFLALVLAVMMVRRYAAGRNAAGNALIGLFLAGSALSALDKFQFSNIYHPAILGVTEVSGVDLADSTTALLLDIGRFPIQVPLHQYWVGEDERLVSWRLPLVGRGVSPNFAWHIPMIVNLMWVPLHSLLLLLVIPMLANRRRYISTSWPAMMRRPALAQS